MSRSITRPRIVVWLVASIFAFVGCGAYDSDKKHARDGSATSDPQAPTASLPKPDGDKLFANWPEPKAAIILSGELGGYLEPCGCTEGQLGGLGRRYDLAERLKRQGWKLAQTDLGGIVHVPAAARGGLKQSWVKFSVALRAFSTMNYDALAVSPDDLRLGVGEVVGQFLNLGDHPKIVACNLRLKDQTDADSPIKKVVRIKTGSVTFGVTVVVAPDEIKALPDSAAWLETLPPEASVAAALADLEKDTDVQVLLVQAAPALARKLALASPGFDIVQERSVYADPEAEPELLNGGKTMLINVGQKGKYVGVVGVFSDSEHPYRYGRVSLNQRYNNAEPMRKLIDEDYQSELKEMKLVEEFPQHIPLQSAPDAKFVGAQACKTCHPNTFARWNQTKHAHAYDALTSKPKRNREFDAECISCHTTGFEYVSGWRSPESTAYLKGNQCENCHGPGSRHAAAPDDKPFREFLTKTVQNADGSRLCLRCHDEDNSPHFDFSKYYGQIVHKGMDKYDDPKVHQGIDLEHLLPTNPAK